MSHQATRPPGHQEFWFKFNGIILVTLCLCVMVTFVFSFAYALSLDKMKVSFLNADYKAAISEGEKIMAGSAQSQESEELYYLLGLSYLKDGNYLRASDIFEIILNEFKTSKFRDEAMLGLGDTYLLKGDFTQAEAAYKKLLDIDPRTKLKAQAFHRLSQVGFKQGDTGQGKEYLEKLRQNFPLYTEAWLDKELCVLPDLSSGAYYAVQVGSFASSVNAKRLTQKLIDKGYSAYMENVKTEGKTIYRVRVGKVNSRQEAQTLEDKLSQEGYPTKICP